MSSGELGGSLASAAAQAAAGPSAIEQGLAFYRVGKIDEALRVLGLYLQRQPNDGNALHLYGLSLMARNDLANAKACLVRSIELQPGNSSFYNNYGEACRSMGDVESAEQAYRKAIELNPQAADALSNLAIVLLFKEQYAMAEEYARQSVSGPNELVPPQAYNTLGTILARLGKLDEARKHFKTAADKNPLLHVAQSNYLMSLNYDTAFSPEFVCDAHARYGKVLVERLTPANLPSLKVRGRIRIGFLSPDFRKHSVAYFVQPLLTHLDRNLFHVTLYADHRQADEVTLDLRRLADTWREVAGLSDQVVYRQMQLDELDILIDLTGHTAGNRLTLFAMKPAPVAASIFGYPATTGLPTIDYRISDMMADPPGYETHYTEKLHRLDRLCWCFAPWPDAPDVGPLPAEKNGYITFGSFNNIHKITSECAAVWAEIIRAHPGSKLLVLAAAGADNDHARQLFQSAGVPEQSLVLAPKRPREQYLALIGSADLALDPFPYNGGITTAETLWQGVPVLAVAGNAYVSRQGMAILTDAGLEQFIAPDPGGLVKTASHITQDISKLIHLRASMRQRLLGSSLLDAKGYARSFEKGILQILGK